MQAGAIVAESVDLIKEQSELAVQKHIAGHYLEAEKLYRRAMAALPDENKEHSAIFQELLLHNARLLLNMGEAENALKMAQQLLKLKERQFGFHHTQTASALRLNAEIKAEQDNTSYAALDMRRALDIWMDTLGWQAPAPDPDDFDLHAMGGQRTTLPEFDWIASELNQPALFERLSEEQKDARRFTLLLEIGNAFSWLGLHKTSCRLFRAALPLVERVSPYLVWQNYWAATQASISFSANEEPQVAEAFLSAFLQKLSSAFENGSDVAPVLQISLAKVLAKRNDKDGAVSELRKALEELQAMHGETHLQVARVHIQLAEILGETGDFSNAESHFDTAISALESWHGLSDINLVVPLFKRGMLMKNAHQLAKAEKSLARAIDILLPRNQSDIDLASTLFKELSHVYMGQHYYQQALTAQIRGLDLLREHCKPTDRAVAECELNMARIYFANARHIDSERNARSALSVYEKLPEKHKERGELHLIIAKCEIDNCKFTQASQSLRAAEAQLEQAPDAVELQQELNLEYAKFYLHQASPGKAVFHLKEIIDTESGAKPKRLTAQIIEAAIKRAEIELAYLDCSLGEKILLANVQIARDSYLNSDKEPSYLLKALSALGEFFVNQSDVSEADAVVEQCTALVEHHPELRSTPAYGEFLTMYAHLLFNQGAFEVATEKLKKALQVIEICHGSHHPKCADIWMAISAALLRRGITDQSDESAHKAVTILSNTFDWHHPSTLRALSWEAYIAVYRERYEVALTLAERLFPGIQSIRSFPDFFSFSALVSILKNEYVNGRTSHVNDLSAYLEKYSAAFLRIYGARAMDVLFDLISFALEKDVRPLGRTAGGTIIKYLSSAQCLLENPRDCLHQLSLICREHRSSTEAQQLYKEIANLLND